MVRVCVNEFPAGIKNNKKDGYYMDRYLHYILGSCKDAVKDDWDMLMLVDGAEGSGKSVLAQQIGFYCDPTLTLDRCVFNPKSFKEAVKNAKKYQAIIYDEAYGGLASRKAMSDLNKSLVSMLTRIRKNNLFIIIVSPSYFDVDKYVSIWRSRFLFHVYSKNFVRGYFKIYNYKRKKLMYMLGKPTYSYKVTSNYRCRFTNFYTFDEKEYRKKKDMFAIEEPEEVLKHPIIYKKQAQKKIITNLFNNIKEIKISKTKLARWSGLSISTIKEYLKNGESRKAEA